MSKFIFLLASFVILNSYTTIAQKTTKKPNIIYINVDDLGYGDVGVYGATKVRTPNIDKLADQGIRFTDAHTVSAVCTPSRYAVITGEYPVRNNNLSSAIFDRDSLIIDTNKLTIADVFKQQGYATACIGKWHLGFGNKRPVDWNAELKPGPLELGFDYYYGVPVLNSHPPFVYVENYKVVGLTEDDPLIYGKEAKTQPYPEKWNKWDQKIGGAEKAHELYIDSKVGTTLKGKALDYIKSNSKKPFFLYFATTNIHHPFTPDKRFLGTSDAGRYGDFIHELDWIVGEIMQTLDEEGLTDNTLLILTSDNGGMLNQGGQDAYAMDHKINGDLLGFKFDAWEGGHRIPFIARWPGHIKPQTVSNALISNVDMLATFAAIVSTKIPKGQAVDSKNLLSVLTNSKDKTERSELLIAPNNLNNLALRQGKWMYISGQGGGGFGAKHQGMHDFGGPAAFPFTGQTNSDIANGQLKEDAPEAQLYNLETDPYQHKNVYDEHPEIVKQMKARIEAIKKEH
ncbi:arylsulfatase [Subsaxibacter sp. CAU 1640]|uniref:sulfatase family protein n=1 Tax=Subsaxibacter sp. CAU 1640 TaxID=2933271 RepID=UPI002004BCAD|nr:arylsulfatase [Subsaxibacter sp. CAU 1640]MCK7591868.1 arylsulfatase [Subsaxibacter sp. CAU 1640]